VGDRQRHCFVAIVVPPGGGARCRHYTSEAGQEGLPVTIKTQGVDIFLSGFALTACPNGKLVQLKLDGDVVRRPISLRQVPICRGGGRPEQTEIDMGQRHSPYSFCKTWTRPGALYHGLLTFGAGVALFVPLGKSPPLKLKNADLMNFGPRFVIL
jgi:hypothetical protein